MFVCKHWKLFQLLSNSIVILSIMSHILLIILLLEIKEISEQYKYFTNIHTYMHNHNYVLLQ